MKVFQIISIPNRVFQIEYLESRSNETGTDRIRSTQIYNYLLSVRSKEQLKVEGKNEDLNEAIMLVGS